MIKSLLYKYIILIKKYYLWLILGFIMMYLTIPLNILIFISPLVLLLFQGICVKSTIQIDNESNFREYIFSAIGEKKYIDSIYLLVVFNIIFSLFITLLFMYAAGLSFNLVLVFSAIYIFICSFVWAIQLPMSYSSNISSFRIIELLLIIFAMVMVFGLGSRYYGKYIYTIVKVKPIMWNNEFNISFNFIEVILVLITSIVMLCISRLLLVKKNRGSINDKTIN